MSLGTCTITWVTSTPRFQYYQFCTDIPIANSARNLLLSLSTDFIIFQNLEISFLSCCDFFSISLYTGDLWVESCLTFHTQVQTHQKRNKDKSAPGLFPDFRFQAPKWRLFSGHVMSTQAATSEDFSLLETELAGSKQA